MMKKRRVVRESLLVVCEGAAEVALVRHARDLYCCGGVGRSVKYRNVGGYGAENVVRVAAAVQRRREHDHVAAMFDTDTGWTPGVRKLAERERIILLKSTPCLEAEMLNIYGLPAAGTSSEHKNRFYREFSGEAHEPGVIATHFTKELLDGARDQVELLECLLKALGIPKPTRRR